MITQKTSELFERRIEVMTTRFNNAEFRVLTDVTILPRSPRLLGIKSKKEFSKAGWFSYVLCVYDKGVEHFEEISRAQFEYVGANVNNLGLQKQFRWFGPVYYLSAPIFLVSAHDFDLHANDVRNFSFTQKRLALRHGSLRTDTYNLTALLDAEQNRIAYQSQKLVVPQPLGRQAYYDRFTELLEGVLLNTTNIK